jgi:imidazolonepropionase-like amidohydrolase
MSEPLVVWADRVIVDVDRPVVENAAVVVRDGCIEDIRVGRAPGALAFPGCTLLPGLIDCHIHLAIEADANDPMHRKEPEAIMMLRMAKNAAINLRAGVTACRDVGTRSGMAIWMKEAFRKRLYRGPRVYASGRPLGAPEGHCNYMTVDVRNAGEAREAVRGEIGAGADVIKLMVTGGLIPPSRGTQMAPDSVRAAVEEAHRLEIPVAAHSETREGARLCAEAGVDSIEHGIELEDDVLDTMAARGLTFVPTLTAFHQVVQFGHANRLPEDTLRRASEMLEHLQTSLRRAIEMRVPVAAGTDYKHGSIALELELMVQFGAAPKDALRAATKTASRLLRVDKTLGTLEQGKWADFIAVAGDPLANIGAVNRVQAVVLDGALVHSAQAAG